MVNYFHVFPIALFYYTWTYRKAIYRFVIFDSMNTKVFFIEIKVTMVGVCASLFLIVVISFDNYDHFFCSGLRNNDSFITHNT